MEPQVISVSEFVAIINETLGFAYPQVVVEGEISSFNVNRGKFVFFDLKDETSTLNCFMMIHQLKLPLEDGMKVRVTGSLEDLAAFSTEPVARAVAASRTPIVVGVGHEVDFSLADFAADLRAATPTDAARLVVPDRRELTAHVTHLVGRSESRLRAAVA